MLFFSVIKMKRIYAALAIVAIVGLAVLVEAGANGIDNMGDEFAEKWQKFKHMWRHMEKKGNVIIT